MREASASAPRSLALDAARGGAVVAMALFHLTWDLGHFGYIDAAIPFSATVKAFGHAIAFAFLAIAGLSLVLSQDRPGARARFWRRLALVLGAAALVSAGTYAAFPDRFVFFGILHCIALSSLLAAPLLRVSSWKLTFALALAAGAAPLVLKSTLFDAPALWWVGLSTVEPLTNDYRPLLPWSGALLLGVAAGQWLREARLARKAPAASGLAPARSALRPLAFLGRHSLLIYLVHQPLLFAAFGLADFGGAARQDRDFLAACERECVAAGSALESCSAACLCTQHEVAFGEALKGMSGAARDDKLKEIARACFARTGL